MQVSHTASAILVRPTANRTGFHADPSDRSGPEGSRSGVPAFTNFLSDYSDAPTRGAPGASEDAPLASGGAPDIQPPPDSGKPMIPMPPDFIDLGKLGGGAPDPDDPPIDLSGTMIPMPPEFQEQPVVGEGEGLGAPDAIGDTGSGEGEIAEATSIFVQLFTETDPAPVDELLAEEGEAIVAES
ncbi:MAG: hypothetical protein KDK89_08285 [Alphaproteobacteria bacterium]|nr:hypothetical protein [Alphaproteobacteria bacterium]